MPRLSRKVTLAQSLMSATQFARYHPSPDNWIRKSTQHDTSEVLCMPRHLKMDTSRCWACPETCCACHANGFGCFVRHVRMSRKARLPRKTRRRTRFEPLECERLLQLTPQAQRRCKKPNNGDDTSWSFKEAMRARPSNLILCTAAKSTISATS